MSACLVTGGAGFIGSHLVDALVARGHRVRVLDNLSTGSVANLAEARTRVEIISGSVTDLDVVRAAMRDIRFVFHLAATTSVPQSITAPVQTHHVGATGTLHVLLAAREAGVRRVVYAASWTAYGPTSPRPACETDATLPATPYAVAKLAGEEYCAAFGNVYGLEAVRLRFFNVYGPRQSTASSYAQVIPAFAREILAGRSPVVFGDGRQSRDYVAVPDAIQAALLAMEAPRAAGRVYNIASGTATCVGDLAARLAVALGTRASPVFQKTRTSAPRDVRADIGRAQAELGFCPCFDLDRGLRLYAEQLRRPAVRHDPPGAGPPAPLGRPALGRAVTHRGTP